jgi:DNA polymerase
LDKLSLAVGGAGKDPNGKRLIDLLCIIKNGKTPAIGPAHRLLLDYNQRDVEELELIYNMVKGHGEPDVMDVDYTVNDRGVPIDVEMLHELKDLFARNAAEAERMFFSKTGGINPRSPKQVREWLKSVGFDFPAMNKEVYDKFVGNPDDYFIGDTDFDAGLELVQDVLESRRELVRVGGSKVQAAIDQLDIDNRIRDQFVYYGAHTGRWSSRRLQLHNLPKGGMHNVKVRGIPTTYEAYKAAADEAAERSGCRVPMADALNAGIRHIVKCDMLVADYAQVEARCAAWMANQEDQLALYKDPSKSVYIELGSKLFRRRINKKDDMAEYDMAKGLVLGCMYGMSGARFEAQCRTRGMDMSVLHAAGIDVRASVRFYRETYNKIVLLWKAMGEAVLDAVSGVPSAAGRCLLFMRGPNLVLTLPSGREIQYRNARIEMAVPLYCKLYNLPEIPVKTVAFDKPNGRNYLYGSRLVENADQGICRDFVADAVVRCEQAGMHPFLHVHDEVACAEDESRFEEFMELMSTPPTWAPGFPLMLEGYAGSVWTKDSKGFREAVALNGRIL